MNHLTNELIGGKFMSTYSKRTTVTLRPEWEPMLNKLKKDRFYNESKSEMIRYIIGVGLASLEDNQEKITICDEIVEDKKKYGIKLGKPGPSKHFYGDGKSMSFTDEEV